MPRYPDDCREFAEQIDFDAEIVGTLVAAAERRLQFHTQGKLLTFPQARAAGMEGLRAAAEVIYMEIRDYEPSIHLDSVSRPQTGQQFRSIQEMMADGRANSLELSLLYASCAWRVGLDPVLLFPAHKSTTHPLVGLWLPNSETTRNRICRKGGFIAWADIPPLVNAHRFADGDHFLERLELCKLLVIDCVGAVQRLPTDSSQQYVAFEDAITRAWKPISSNDTETACAVDLRGARVKVRFPTSTLPEMYGRTDDLKKLEQSCENNNTVISGGLGVGKTTLALQYAFKYRYDYPDGVFRLNAADGDRITLQLADFARSIITEPDPTLSTDNLASYWINEMNKPGTQALLIVDNVSDYCVITEPIIDGESSLSELPIRLVITSRDDKLLNGEDVEQEFETMVLAPLDDDEAKAFLLSELPPHRRDEAAALRVCKLLNNLPLLLRIASRVLAEPPAQNLRAYAKTLERKGFLSSANQQLPDSDNMIIMLKQTLNDLKFRANESRNLLKLLSILTRNESIPFELLALMIDPETSRSDGETRADKDARIERVRQAVNALSAVGLAEQLEDNEVKIHPFVHEFATELAATDPGFLQRALNTAADRLHDPAFYRPLAVNDLVRYGRQLSLLHETGDSDERLALAMRVIDVQLDNLRDGNDAFSQLAIQAHLVGASELAQTLEAVRSERPGPWLRLVWRGHHQGDHPQLAPGHSDAVTAVALWPSADRSKPQVAVSGAENGELFKWTLKPFELARRLIDNGPAITCVCIDPDGNTVYYSARDGALRAAPMNGDAAQTSQIVGRHAYPANHCAIDPNGEFVACAFEDGTARIYDLSGSKMRALALKHEEKSPILKCAVARRADNGEAVLLTASEHGVVRAWNPHTGEQQGQPLYTPPDGRGLPVSACALSPEGRLAAVVTRQNALLWNLDTLTVTELPSPERYVQDCSFSPDGKQLLLVGRSKRAAVYRIAEGNVEHPLEPWYHWLTACAFGADGQIFYTADDGSVHSSTYNSYPSSRRVPGSIPGQTRWTNVVVAGPQYVVSVSTDRTVCRWDLSDGTRELLNTGQGHAHWLNAFTVSTDGKFVFSGKDTELVAYWPLEDFTQKLRLPGFTQRANTCDISKDGSIGLAGSEDYTLMTWSLKTFEKKRHLTNGHRAPVTTCALSADNKYAISGGEDARVVRWRLDNGEFTPFGDREDGHRDRITAVAFDHDDPDKFYSASWDHRLICWSAEWSQMVTEFKGHSDCVTDCGTATGGVLFSVSLDRTLRRWHRDNGVNDLRIRLDNRLRGLVVDSLGKWVVCSDMSGKVYRFDVMSGSPNTTAQT